MKNQELLIGAHTSAAGGAFKALLEGKQIGATTIQLFTANQKRWEGKPLVDEDIAAWKKALAETGLKKIMSHDSYLINLGCPNEETLLKSRAAFREELIRCQQLEIDFLNFHPGAALHESPERCLEVIVESLNELEPLAAKGKTKLLLETTAGQGSAVGWRFEELGYIIERAKVPLGVCLDTCHVFVAGYDIRTAEGWEKTLDEFDRHIGLKYLCAFHINDSMKELGSRVDRHDYLGKGKIGIESFKFLMQDKRTRELPKYLETPGGCEAWVEEIALLRSFA